MKYLCDFLTLVLGRRWLERENDGREGRKNVQEEKFFLIEEALGWQRDTLKHFLLFKHCWKLSIQVIELMATEKRKNISILHCLVFFSPKQFNIEFHHRVVYDAPENKVFGAMKWNISTITSRRSFAVCWRRKMFTDSILTISSSLLVCRSRERNWTVPHLIIFELISTLHQFSR